MHTAEVIMQGVPVEAKASQPMADPSALKELGWPPGLTTMVASSLPSLPLRFVIVDNSGSMGAMDGSRLVQGPKGFQRIQSSRWQELSEAVTEFANVGLALNAPCHFHFLNSANGGQFFCLGDEFAPLGGFVSQLGAPRSNLSALKGALASSPMGTTPLTEAIERVESMIRPHEQLLSSSGQKAVIVISTDGKPNTPKTFVEALKRTQKLPVWVVVRLCTDESDVVDYWSELDAALEAPLEVLDDLKGEAEEVYKLNKWLTYGPAIHMARMFGVQDRIFDLLDEQRLVASQAKELAEKILGCPPLPEPEGFKTVLSAALAQTRPVYHPVHNRVAPWFDINGICSLNKRSGADSCCVVL